MLSEEPISAVHPLLTGINKLSTAAYLQHLYSSASNPFYRSCEEMLHQHFSVSEERWFYLTLMDVTKITTDKSLANTPMRLTEYQQTNEALPHLKCKYFHLQQTGFRVSRSIQGIFCLTHKQKFISCCNVWHLSQLPGIII
jgi:hypothetical protein